MPAGAAVDRQRNRGRHLGEPDVADLARRHQVGQRADGVFDRHAPVQPVHVVEVDHLGAEALEARLALRLEMFRTAVEHPLAVAHAHHALAGEEHVLSARTQGNRLALGPRRPVGVALVHAAEADGLDSGMVQSAWFEHGGFASVAGEGGSVCAGSAERQRRSAASVQRVLDCGAHRRASTLVGVLSVSRVASARRSTLPFGSSGRAFSRVKSFGTL